MEKVAWRKGQQNAKGCLDKSQQYGLGCLEERSTERKRFTGEKSTI
jgi:hypothetical protein